MAKVTLPTRTPSFIDEIVANFSLKKGDRFPWRVLQTYSVKNFDNLAGIYDAMDAAAIAGKIEKRGDDYYVI